LGAIDGGREGIEAALDFGVVAGAVGPRRGRYDN
jgi:hypothetical protein